MIKTIEINNKEITLSNNNEWIFIYNDQFGRDIIETIMPLISAGLQVVGGIIEELGDAKNLDVRDVAKIYNTDAMRDAFIYLMTIRLTDLIDITWSMAKAADPDIKPPRQWAREIENFPVDIVAPAVADLLTRGLASSKNLDRLRDRIKALRPEK